MYHSNVIWLQGTVCLAVWIAYGVIQTRRSDYVRSWAVAVPIGRQIPFAIGLLVGSIILVFGTLSICLANHGFGVNGMTPVVWLIVAVIGLAFVHGQTLATAILVTAATRTVTANAPYSSTTQAKLEPSNDEIPT